MNKLGFKRFSISILLLAWANISLALKANPIENFEVQLKQNTQAAKKYYLQIYQNKYNQISQDPNLQAVLPVPQQNLSVPPTPIPTAPPQQSIFNANTHPTPQQNIFQ